MERRADRQSQENEKKENEEKEVNLTSSNDRDPARREAGRERRFSEGWGTGTGSGEV